MYEEVLAKYERDLVAGQRRSQTAEVIGWVAYDVVPSEGPQRIGGWGGFFQRGDRWKHYIETYHEGVVPFYEALRNEVLRLGLKHGGDWHQNDPKGVPVFNDGTVAMFSFRAWGDLMAAIWAEHEDRDYDYMDFYMDCCIASDQ